MKTVYLSGKVTGLPLEEVAAKFNHAENLYTSLGYKVCNPFKSIQEAGYQDWPYDAIMKVCIVMLMGCDAIVFLL